MEPRRKRARVALEAREVDLAVGVCEFAAVGTADLEVDLGPVERRLSDADLILLAHRLERFAERRLRQLPLLLGPQPLLLDVVARRQPVRKLIDAKDLAEIQRELDRTLDLIHELIRGAENVRIVSRE